MIFFPVGFGAFLRKFPWAIITIALISFVWTSSFLEDVRTVSALLGEEWKVVSDLRLKAIKAACKNNLKESSSACSSIGETKAQHENALKNYPKLLDFFLLHKGELLEWPKESQNTPEYKDALIVENNYNDYRNKLQDDHDFFTIHQRDFLRATRATFTHADWVHFSFNILLLVLLGIWVEQSLGPIRTASIFLLTSYMGLYSEIIVMNANAILGASAGVMGIVSAFFILFYIKRTCSTLYIHGDLLEKNFCPHCLGISLSLS